MGDKNAPPPPYIEQWSGQSEQQTSNENNTKQYPSNAYPNQQQSYYQPQTVMQQPYEYFPPTVVACQTPQYAGPPPDNHSMLAWLTCLFCFWPLGLIAIIKSLEVNNAINRGDMLSARQASTNAKKFGYASLVLGIISYFVVAAILVVYIVVVIPRITDNDN